MKPLPSPGLRALQTAGLFALLACSPLFADPVVAPSAGLNHMTGVQSNNMGLPAIPAAKPPVIDGDLSEWDLSGRMWSFNDIALRDQYSVETAAMWDKDYLYLALRWQDPTPAMNFVNPATDPTDGWKSDAVQLRIDTEGRVQWITAWPYTADGSANVRHEVLNDPNNDRMGTVKTDYFGKSGDIGGGFQSAYKKTGPGSYTQELRIPWAAIYAQKPEPKPGDHIRIGFEYFWGDSSNKGWPGLRYADNLQPGSSAREFFWRARRGWGDVTLMDRGNLPLRQYKLASIVREGEFQCAVELPKAAKRFTLVIDDAKGRRVRNLVADVSPSDYATAENAGGVKVSVPWDGRNDAGEAVPAGNYKVRGLWHAGLDATYDFTLFNPGTPPWATLNGRGSWGSNHCNPEFVAAAGDWMIVGWEGSEGGSAIVGVDPAGLKAWGELRGSNPLAADSERVYACYQQQDGALTAKITKLFRLDAKTGQYSPFQIDGKDRTFPLPVTELLGRETAPNVTALAAGKASLAMALEGGEIAFLDKNTAKPLRTISTTKAVIGLAWAPNGDLYIVAGTPEAKETNRDSAGWPLADHAAVKDGQLFKLEKEALLPVKAAGLKDARTVSVDAKGNAVVFDRGDQQIKAFTPAGKLAYTAGAKGGRPVRGLFNKDAMREVTSVAVDAKGDIWATEKTDLPPRVSVWSAKTGKLVRDYIGGTGYAGVGCHLFEDDASLAYVGPIELKMDPVTKKQQVTQILWAADPAQPEEPASFNVDIRSNAIANRFSSKASGQKRQYLFNQPNYYWGEPTVLFMQDEKTKNWRPVAALGLVGHLSGKLDQKGNKMLAPTSGDYADCSVWDAFIWNDENADGRVQRKEVTVVPAEFIPDQAEKLAAEAKLEKQPKNTLAEKVAKLKADGKRPPKTSLPMGNGWNSGIDKGDLSFLVSGIFRYSPARFTKEGAPVYSPEKVAQLGAEPQPQYMVINVPGDNVVVGLGGFNARQPKGQSQGLSGFDGKTGERLWGYPNLYNSVHGSHLAPMAKAGLLIGPLKFMGVTRVSDTVGSIFTIRGNLGQDFFYTSDGLYVGSLFRDCRYPSTSLPEKAEEMEGVSMIGYSEGGEPFSGWFGRGSDGKLRILTSIARTGGLAVQLSGLEGVTRFAGPAIAVSEAQSVKIAAEPPPQEAAVEPKVYAIAKVAAPLPVTGKGVAEAWKAVPFIDIAKEGTTEKARVQLAHDGANLYLRWQVTDASPLLNGGQDFHRLFKDGDCVDLQLGPAPADAKANLKDPRPGDLRLLLSTLKGQPVGVLMQPLAPAGTAKSAWSYTSPVGTKAFDRVEQPEGLTLAAEKAPGGYTYAAVVPLARLGVDYKPGLKLRGDLGFISSDAQGTINIARTYWANSATGLVNDEPMEAWFSPATWGEFTLE